MDAEKEKMTGMMNRRRFLSVCAMAGAFSAIPWSNAFAATPLHRWSGILLGAEVSLTLAHPDRQKANKIFDRCVTEIKRLENIFTLYDSHSELSILNANGMLKNPSLEMVDILKKAHIYHDMTEGAFDVTVKALEEGRSSNLVGMDKLYIDPKEIRLEKHGMAITLNGIAQGYITDYVTEFLKAEGLENVLVELGEKRAIGSHPSGRPWFLALQGEKQPVPLSDKALATSVARSPDTQKAHILNPLTGRTGQRATKQESVSVLADNATMADALSTGFILMDETKINAIKARSSQIFHVYRR